MIIISSHFVKSEGNIYLPVVDNFKILFKKQKYLVIEHSLNNDFHSHCYFSDNSKKYLLKGINYKNNILKYTTEVTATIRLLKKLNLKDKVFFIGINPLNALIGYLYKRYNSQTKLIYFIPDYSPKRFDNIFLNWIYHLIEKFVSKKADVLLCVSNEIYKLKNTRKNVFLYKNYPPKGLLPKNKINRNKNSLVMLGFLDNYYLIDEIYEALKKINAKVKKKCILYFIGSGPKINDYKKLAKKKSLSKYVKFLGHIKKNKIIKTISQFGIGLAVYSDNFSFNKYRDSVKIRDCIATGLPVITTSNHSNAKEVSKYKLGIVVKNQNNLSDAILNAYNIIITNYYIYKKNCLDYYYKDYNNEQILKKILK